MNRACKIRCYPNKTQIQKIHQIFGACRYVMNLYIEYNNQIDGFLSGYDFAKIITKLKKEDPKYEWLNQVSTKALKDAIIENIYEISNENAYRKSVYIVKKTIKSHVENSQRKGYEKRKNRVIIFVSTTLRGRYGNKTDCNHSHAVQGKVRHTAPKRQSRNQKHRRV